jgi:site-specific DNA-methyltransferase (adenine-specific)
MKGDCLELMKDIPDGSVDLILTDPPYGTTACKWDSIIDLPLMWEQLKRIIKPNGAIVLFGGEPFSTALRMSNIKNYKYDWVWEKNMVSGVAQAKNKPITTHENIIVFSDGVTVHASQSKKRMPYFPQGLVPLNKEMKNRKHDHIKAGGIGQRPSHKEVYVQENTNYPRSVLRFKCERGLHPTQKPVELLEYLVKTYTNENETVLDFTMGSGSTGVAAKNLDRSFIGIEMDEGYFKIAKDRIDNINNNPLPDFIEIGK